MNTRFCYHQIISEREQKANDGYYSVDEEWVKEDYSVK